MTLILPFLMLLIFFAVVATCFTEGMWSNAVRLINVVTAALLAVNFFEPLARTLDNWQPSYTYLWDFLSLWGLFGISLLIFREITDRVSHVNVRFLKLANRIGGVVFSIWVGWVMVCFTMMTLHTAPLGRNFLFEGFSTQTDARMMFGMASPDVEWLGFTQKMSTGAFAGSEEFDPRAEFMPKYATRRTDLEKRIATSDTLRVGP